MESTVKSVSFAAVDTQTRVMAAVVAALLGVFILWATGFAGADLLHNAAHDGRHAFSFPCH
jgi:cobalt transporter subunit CbtB